MSDYIIIGVLTAVIVLAVISCFRHFRGEGGCCGGGSYKPKRKKLKSIRYRKTFRIVGMHCEHCRRRVEEAINDIKGVAGKVDLRKGELTVFYAVDVDDETVKARIERAGYTVGE